MLQLTASALFIAPAHRRNSVRRRFDNLDHRRCGIVFAHPPDPALNDLTDQSARYKDHKITHAARFAPRNAFPFAIEGRYFQLDYVSLFHLMMIPQKKSGRETLHLAA
jgi:hypothetical protein